MQSYTYTHIYACVSRSLFINGKNVENDNSSRRQRRRIALFWWWQRKQKNKTTVLLITSKSSKKSDPLLSFCILAVNIDMHEVQILRSPVTGSEYHIRLTVWYGWRFTHLHRFKHQTKWHRKCRSNTWIETKPNETKHSSNNIKYPSRYRLYSFNAFSISHLQFILLRMKVCIYAYPCGWL